MRNAFSDLTKPIDCARFTFVKDLIQGCKISDESYNFLIVPRVRPLTRKIALGLRKYRIPIFLYLFIPALAAIIACATGILVVSHSQGELGPQTASYGFPLPWVTVGDAQGCQLPTPFCFVYSIDWAFLTLDMLLYSSVSFALMTILLRVSRTQFAPPLARQLNWSTVKTIMTIILIAIAFEPIVAATSLPHLPCVACPTWDSLTMVSFRISSPTNLTLSLKNADTLTVQLENYEVQDSNGNQWWRIWLPPNQSTGTWWSGPSIPPNATGIANITIGSSCGNCTYQGAPGAFTQFSAGNSYTVTVVTARDYQFPFQIRA